MCLSDSTIGVAFQDGTNNGKRSRDEQLNGTITFTILCLAYSKNSQI